jgi:hypothetical protein
MLPFALPDDNGCAGNKPCAGKLNSNGLCNDVPAPDTGYSCGCLGGFAWDAFTAACVACVSIVAGNEVKGYSGDGKPATQAQLNGPVYTSRDAAGNLYIAGESALLQRGLGVGAR